jgi:hypothetical protein
VIAITSETPDMQGELNLVWKYLLPAMQVDKSGLDKNDAAALKKRLALLKLPLPAKADSSFAEPKIINKIFKIESNPKNIETISFKGKDRLITLDIKMKGTSYTLNFGDGKWIEGKTTMPGPSLVEGAKNHFVGLPASQIAGAYSWKAPNVLEMRLRYIDSPHTLLMTFSFDHDTLKADLLDSFKTPDKKITLKGQAAK